jgi:hypothetical protein
MHKRTNIQLSVADRKELEAVVANRNSPQKHVWRAKIVLPLPQRHRCQGGQEENGACDRRQLCRSQAPEGS